MNCNEEFITAFIDSFVENDCLQDALRLKWLRAAELQGRIR
jgi:hypothetical protein